jgi:Predicted nucleotide-binding protein containing TIR-like domain
MAKPSVFIGSSTEGLDFARAVRSLLDQDAEVTVWNEGFFSLGNTFIETLVTQSPRFDFAILILTPDHLMSSRGLEVFSARDNVIFELGLFMGRLERPRTFILHQAHPQLKIPSDLSGVTTAQFEWPRADNSYRSAVGAACDSIREVIRDLGLSPGKTSKEINHIKSRQDTMETRLRTLQLVTKGLVSEFEYEKLRGLESGNPFMVRFHHDMYAELKRLDAIRYVEPQPGYGLISIRKYDGSSEEFDLTRYVRITGEGREYLKLRDELFQTSSTS